jgi:hypothetical protein
MTIVFISMVLNTNNNYFKRKSMVLFNFSQLSNMVQYFK